MITRAIRIFIFLKTAHINNSDNEDPLEVE